MIPCLSDIEKKLSADGHQLVALRAGGSGFMLKLTSQHIDFLKSAIPKGKLVYASRKGYYTKFAFPVSLIELVYKKFFDSKYDFEIPEYLAPAFCILADAAKRTIRKRKPKANEQDYIKLEDMQRRFVRGEIPKSISVRYPGRDDSITLSDPVIIMEFWECFLNNVKPIEVGERIDVETILYNTLHPVIGGVTNTHLVIIDLLKIAGSKKDMTPGTIAKGISDQAKRNHTKA